MKTSVRDEQESSTTERKCEREKEKEERTKRVRQRKETKEVRG